MVKKIIFICGKLFSYIFPQNLRDKCEGIKVRFFAGYKSRYFKSLGTNSTLGRHTTYIKRGLKASLEDEPAPY